MDTFLWMINEFTNWHDYGMSLNSWIDSKLQKNTHTHTWLIKCRQAKGSQSRSQICSHKNILRVRRHYMIDAN